MLFAIAICGNPDLLFLDEPTVGLDVEARRLMWSQIRTLIARGKTVLLTTHYLNEADALADRILVLDQGSIVAEGTPAEIKARAMGKQMRCTSQLVARRSSADPRRDQRRHGRSHGFELQVHAAEPVVRELLQRDSWLADLEVTNAGLEEAFLALTQNHNSETQKERTNMAATTFPAVIGSGAFARQNHCSLLQRSEVRVHQEHAHSGLRDLDIGISS